MSTFAHIVGWGFLSPIAAIFWLGGIYAWFDNKLSLEQTVQYWAILWGCSLVVTFCFIALEGWM